MTIFRKLFAFAAPEISCTFKHARAKKYHTGLKLLQAPAKCSTVIESAKVPYGKLLIVTPRACGKAHDRNLIRRQTKAIFYEEELYKTPAIWVLLVRKQAMEVSFDDLKNFLISAMRPCQNLSDVKPSDEQS